MKSSLLTPQFVNLVSDDDDIIAELKTRYRSKSNNTESSEEYVTTKVVDSFFNLIPTKKRKTIKRNEVDQFLELEFTDEEIASDPIDYWNSQSKKFPILSNMSSLVVW